MLERPSVKKLLAYEKEVNVRLCQDGLGNYRVSQTHAVAEKWKSETALSSSTWRNTKVKDLTLPPLPAAFVKAEIDAFLEFGIFAHEFLRLRRA